MPGHALDPTEEFCLELWKLTQTLASKARVIGDELYHAEADVFACVDLHREKIRADRPSAS